MGGTGRSTLESETRSRHPSHTLRVNCDEGFLHAVSTPVQSVRFPVTSTSPAYGSGSTNALPRLRWTSCRSSLGSDGKTRRRRDIFIEVPSQPIYLFSSHFSPTGIRWLLRDPTKYTVLWRPTRRRYKKMLSSRSLRGHPTVVARALVLNFFCLPLHLEPRPAFVL